MRKDGSGNLSIQLANRLKDAIRQGEYLPGEPIPSERELSESNNLSRTTVRRAIQMLADEGILYRKAGVGTYVGEINKVRSLDSTIGLVVPTLANPYYGEFLNAVENYANKRGYQVLIGQSDYTDTRETAYLMRYADEFAVKGVIVVPNIGEVSSGGYQCLTRQNKPFVFVGRCPEQIKADMVSSDYMRGAKRIVSYLIKMGHTKIAYIKGHPHYPDDPLLRGYRMALREANMPEVSERILLLDETAEEAGLKGVYRLVRNELEFTAIFARNDLTASGVLRGLSGVNLCVPDDVSVVGFDSTNLSKHLRPALTTVDTMLQEIARQSTMMLFDRISGTYGGPPRRIMIEPRLIVRESCAPPRKGV